MIKRQKNCEDGRNFDPQNYFGGMEVDNLEDIQDDSRLSGTYIFYNQTNLDMFKNEMDEYKSQPDKTNPLKKLQLQSYKAQNQ